MKNFILHHNDPDGYCAAWLIQEYIESVDEHGWADRMEITYGRPLPEDMFKADRVYILDFSLDMDNMRKLVESVGVENIVWIDHHESAIKKCGGFEHDIPGIRNADFAACHLAYAYVYAQRAGQPLNVFSTDWLRCMPPYVRLVGDYDCWLWKKPEYPVAEAEKVEAFHYGLNAFCWKNPVFWQGFCSGATREEHVMGKGRVIKEAYERMYQSRIESSAWESSVDIDGKAVKMLLLNSSGGSSIWEGSDVKEKYDVVASYVHTPRGFRFSLRSVDTGLALKVAESMGGGGHADAAGFVSADMPFSSD